MSTLEKEPIGIMKNWIRKGTKRDYLQTKQSVMHLWRYTKLS